LTLSLLRVCFDAHAANGSFLEPRHFLYSPMIRSRDPGHLPAIFAAFFPSSPVVEKMF
jgi:hypothetical protein